MMLSTDSHSTQWKLNIINEAAGYMVNINIYTYILTRFWFLFKTEIDFYLNHVHKIHTYCQYLDLILLCKLLKYLHKEFSSRISKSFLSAGTEQPSVETPSFCFLFLFFYFYIIFLYKRKIPYTMEYHETIQHITTLLVTYRGRSSFRSYRGLVYSMTHFRIFCKSEGMLLEPVLLVLWVYDIHTIYDNISVRKEMISSIQNSVLSGETAEMVC